jgi:hypothetical protein
MIHLSLSPNNIKHVQTRVHDISKSLDDFGYRRCLLSDVEQGRHNAISRPVKDELQIFIMPSSRFPELF